MMRWIILFRAVQGRGNSVLLQQMEMYKISKFTLSRLKTCYTIIIDIN